MVNQLAPEFQQFVHEQVTSGQFLSERDVLQEGLRLLQQRQELRRKLQLGREQIERGEGIELDDKSLPQFFDEIDAEVRQELADTAKRRA